ncbi:LURP-one-related/scramblase family protein [Halomarina salina]|uniref:LURP-one-related/scramblase family protein n=1 Tax=Halomarina salina TaxID=1872699 RepID=A0ABD5RK79_9EURY|nr:hypothetical protein [Halomarina salina]
MSQQDVIGGIDLTDDHYVIKQSLIRNKYAVLDSSGQTVLKGKQKLFKMKEDFPFTTPDGETIYRLKAKNVLDIAGDYTLVDERSGDTIAVIEKKFTLFKHTYDVRSPNGEHWGRIESESAVVMALKSLSDIAGLLPHSYSITGPGGRSMGTIKERFSLRDIYDVTVGDTGEAPREAIVAAACAIDALEGN